MASTTATEKRELRSTARIDARLTPEQKMVIQRAADLMNRSVSDFVIDAAYAEAERTIRDHEVTVLSVEASLRFAELLLDPPPPSERMLAAAKRYRELVGE